MPTQVTNYQCPACTGPLHFAEDSGKLECEYCGASYDVAEIEALFAEKEKKAAEAQRAAEEASKGQTASDDDGETWDFSDMQEDWGTDGEGMRSYSCPSCGAELICDESTAATACPYCGNPTIVPGQFSGGWRPDYIIPFKQSKENAVEALKEHYRGKFFLPKAFKKENHVQEIQGIYVPFWMFDGEATGEACYDATRSRTYRSGDYDITETKYYHVYRAGHVAFEKVPVDASSKMPDNHMDSIEPYDYEKLKPFSTAYLPGFLADKFDVTVEQCRQRADQRYEGTLLSALDSTVKRYDSFTLKDSNVKLKRGKVHYALLPVWMLHTKWQGKDFLFAMNGQTGKIVGDLPINWLKVIALFAAIGIPTWLVSFLLVTWLWV